MREELGRALDQAVDERRARRVTHELLPVADTNAKTQICAGRATRRVTCGGDQSACVSRRSLPVRVIKGANRWVGRIDLVPLTSTGVIARLSAVMPPCERGVRVVTEQ